MKRCVGIFAMLVFSQNLFSNEGYLQRSHWGGFLRDALGSYTFYNYSPHYDRIKEYTLQLYREAKLIAEDEDSIQDASVWAQSLSKSSLDLYEYLNSHSSEIKQQVIYNAFDRIRYDYNALVEISTVDLSQLIKIYIAPKLPPAIPQAAVRPLFEWCIFNQTTCEASKFTTPF